MNYAVLPNCGEDSFAVHSGEAGSLLCVADGCGGLGSRRYQELGQKTGAYVASRLVVHILRRWAQDRPALPRTQAEGRAQLTGLENDMTHLLSAFAKKNGLEAAEKRIVGSMQRTLPSTLCAALTRNSPDGEECCFLWAGDSRGYTLTEDGLHQYTLDDVRSPLDPYERLYCDAPLSNCISADQPVRLHMRKIRLPRQGILICSTDGAFSCLPTPMEFEMLLLSTMQAAADAAGWQRKLQLALGKLANDDATVLCRPCGFDSFARMKQFYQLRLDDLKTRYITPVRQNPGDERLVRACWLEYAKAYDRTKGAENEQDDWCL